MARLLTRVQLMSADRGQPMSLDTAPPVASPPAPPLPQLPPEPPFPPLVMLPLKSVSVIGGLIVSEPTADAPPCTAPPSTTACPLAPATPSVRWERLSMNW